MVCELAGLEPDRLLEWARALQLESGWARQRGMADGGCAISTPRPMMASRQPRIPSSINTQTGVSLSKGADEFIATIFATHRTCAVGLPTPAALPLAVEKADPQPSLAALDVTSPSRSP